MKMKTKQGGFWNYDLMPSFIAIFVAAAFFWLLLSMRDELNQTWELDCGGEVYMSEYKPLVDDRTATFYTEEGRHSFVLLEGQMCSITKVDDKL